MENIIVFFLAIVDEMGEVEFIEYSIDNCFFWVVDIFILVKDVEFSLDNYVIYVVEIIIIDKFVGENNFSFKVIKIDIEGFELYVF